jgi:hypothetical protein
MPVAQGAGTCCGARLGTIQPNQRASMGDFYGIKPGTIPGFADAGGGSFMSVNHLPGHTVRNMAMFMDKLRRMHADDPLAFEVCVRHVASMIEDQRREEGRTDPRENPAP